MKDVIVIGASGHGKVVAEIVKLNGDNLVGFLDDDTSKKTLGVIDDYGKFTHCYFIIGIGDVKVREKISKLPVKWYTAIHPSSVVSSTAKIGEGSVITANSVVNVDAVIGRHCIINTGAIVEHDNVINDFTHVSVGAKLGGFVRVGMSSMIGIGATVKNNVSICGNCVVGAGAVVVNDISDKGTYVGIPARKLK